MPQMAPMNWLILFLIFSIIFLAFNMINYFIMKNETDSNKPMIEQTSQKKSLNWKW